MSWFVREKSNVQLQRPELSTSIRPFRSFIKTSQFSLFNQLILGEFSSPIFPIIIRKLCAYIQLQKIARSIHLPARKEGCWKPDLYQIDQLIQLCIGRPHRNSHLLQIHMSWKTLLVSIKASLLCIRIRTKGKENSNKPKQISFIRSYQTNQPHKNRNFIRRTPQDYRGTTVRQFELVK